MNLKLRREFEFSLSFNTLIEKDYGVTIELVSLVFNIKKKVSSVLDSFLSFIKKYMKEKKNVSLDVRSKVQFFFLLSVFIQDYVSLDVRLEVQNSLFNIFIQDYVSLDVRSEVQNFWLSVFIH